MRDAGEFRGSRPAAKWSSNIVWLGRLENENLDRSIGIGATEIHELDVARGLRLVSKWQCQTIITVVIHEH